MRVLLLNPPGLQVYIRDYFCSKTTKSNYLFHPIDLVVMSGTLAEHHDVRVLDCIAERLSPDAARARIDAFAPEVIVSLVGSVSWDEDRAFLADQAARGRRILALGDVLHERAELRLAEEPWLEAALHVFTNQDVVHYLAGRLVEVEEMTVRDEHARVWRIRGRRTQRGVYRVPRPRHELFPERGYHFSFAKHARFATVLSDYGCPYQCTFCVISTLGFQTRPVADVLVEIDELRSRGIREIFFLDQTFGIQKPRALELCAALAERGDLSWTAFTRPDHASDELLDAMVRAGCHTLIMGVETADNELLAKYRKAYEVSDVIEGFANAKRHGLRTVGTFIIGLPEETEETLQRTLELAIELDLDFMSLNMAVPRFGTPFRARTIELGLADAGDLVMDQGGADAFLPTRTLDRDSMLAMKKRMVRRFYLRPGYLWRRFRGAKSLYEFGAQAREGLALLLRNT
ncbi:MAG: radical SAM protein [Planctomycetes bacterium]|nr:radical SAM protein [Planctomycetota bacterium]